MTKILIIEDEASLLESVHRMLQFEGYEPIGAENGAKGIQLAREHLPDLIICDVVMPEVDGYSVLQELRNELSTATIPFIFLTAMAGDDRIRMGMELGADDYLTKPFQHEKLLTAIRTRLAKQANIEKQHLQVLAQYLVDMQETERQLIANELHNDIGRILISLQMIMGMNKRLPPDSAISRWDEAQALVRELISRISKMSLELYPLTLKNIGLLSALLEYFQHYTEQTLVQVKFKHTEVERRFPSKLETIAYRIVQEALTNVARHTSVNEVDVRLWVDQNELVIQVEDKGEGFDLEKIATDNIAAGLTGLHERVKLLNGQFTVTSIPGEGTYIMARLPIREFEERTPEANHSLPTAPISWAFSNPEEILLQKAEALEQPTIPTQDKPLIRVVLIEEYDLIRQGLRSLLELEPGFSVIGEGKYDRDALPLVEKLQPDVLIIDLKVGLDVIEGIANNTQETAILVLSSNPNEVYIMDVFKRGATGYALKESSTEELVRAIVDVVSGRHFLSRELFKHAIDFYTQLRATEDLELSSYSVLTNREREVFLMVVNGAKTAEIADQFYISPRTVETHRASIMRKLNLRTQADLVRYALQQGIITLDE